MSEQRKFEDWGDGRFVFWCPGCNTNHAISVKPGRWTLDLNTLTVTPSILAQGAIRCHSFVRNGMIEFLKDSEHHLAGKTVPLPDTCERLNHGL